MAATGAACATGACATGAGFAATGADGATGAVAYPDDEWAAGADGLATVGAAVGATVAATEGAAAATAATAAAAAGALVAAAAAAAGTRFAKPYIVRKDDGIALAITPLSAASILTSDAAVGVAPRRLRRAARTIGAAKVVRPEAAFAFTPVAAATAAIMPAELLPKIRPRSLLPRVWMGEAGTPPASMDDIFANIFASGVVAPTSAATFAIIPASPDF